MVGTGWGRVLLGPRLRFLSPSSCVPSDPELVFRKVCLKSRRVGATLSFGQSENRHFGRDRPRVGVSVGCRQGWD